MQQISMYAKSFFRFEVKRVRLGRKDFIRNEYVCSERKELA